MPTPAAADAESTLAVLLAEANDHEDPVIRAVAIRAGLLRQCRCDWYNPVGADRCETCRTRVLAETEPRSVQAIGLIAVRDYLTEAHDDGVARFVAACRAGICGGLAFDVADEVIAGAEHYSYGRSWPVIAAEIIADVEARAAGNPPRPAPATAP